MSYSNHEPTKATDGESTTDEREELRDELKRLAASNPSATETPVDEGGENETASSREFLDWLEDSGIRIADRQVAEEALDSQELPNIALKAVLARLNISLTQARSLGVPLKQRLTKISESRFRESLEGSDWQERLRPENIYIDSAWSTREANPEQVSIELAKILQDKDLSFMQGTIWNAIVSDQSLWAAKYVKGEESEYDATKVMETQMHQFQAVRDIMGDEMLLGQIAFHLGDRKTPMILQEKLNLDEWIPLGVFNKGVIDQVRTAISKHPDNAAVLNTFLDQIARLQEEKGLVLDLSGDNVVFQLDNMGKMNIKIIDYGCTPVMKEDATRLEHLLGHAKQLRTLTQV